MEPFAFENSKKPATPWVIAAILFAALVAWQLDYFPRLRPASSGTLAETSSSLHAVTPLDASWDEIVDRSADLQPTRNDAADPLQSALAMQSEPLDTTVVPENTRNSLRQDSMVRPASFELAEPTDLSAQSSSDADSDSQMGVIPAELAERLRAIDMLFRDGNIAEAHAKIGRAHV